MTNKSKLILNTFDGTMKNLQILPQQRETVVEFEINYYNYEDKAIHALMQFNDVIAIDFQVNYFDNCFGTDLCGFYEIIDIDYKANLLNKIFLNRREGFLMHGDYHYDEEDKNDKLNWRDPVESILQEIDQYHLYQQQTDGGVFLIFCKDFILIDK